MTAHHPAPWGIDNPVQSDSLTIQCEGVTLASIDLGNVTGDDLARLLASAKVMRAAPALLAALTEIISQIDQGGSGGKVFARDHCITAARDAIAQTKGGQ